MIPDSHERCRYFEAFINGHRVGNSSFPSLDPGFTSFEKRVLYTTYDVTNLLLSGKKQGGGTARNVLAVSLGSGWWNPLPLLFWGHLNLRDALTVGTQTMVKLDLVLEYSNGTKHTVVSSLPGASGGWKTGNGPLLQNDIYLGLK